MPSRKSLEKRSAIWGSEFGDLCRRQSEPKYIACSFKQVKRRLSRFSNETFFPALTKLYRMLTNEAEHSYYILHLVSCLLYQPWPVRKTSSESYQEMYWKHQCQLSAPTQAAWANTNGMLPSRHCRDRELQTIFSKRFKSITSFDF